MRAIAAASPLVKLPYGILYSNKKIEIDLLRASHTDRPFQPMLFSLHIADIGPRHALAFLRSQPSTEELKGLRYALTTIAAPLGPHLLPRPKFGRVALIAAWDDDEALDRFLSSHPLATRLSGGWQVRLAPTRVFGAWHGIEGLPSQEQPMDEHEPVAVLTLGRLRLTQTLRFLRASAAAEGLAVREPALLTSTGLARLPHLVATFSLWRTTAAMRAYATGQHQPEHRAAVQAHAAQPFHHESAFIRLRPYAAHGSWDGREPLTDAQTSSLVGSSSC